MMQKRISVIMTTYNAPKELLYKQMESIVNQTVAPDEVIIVDDFSSDDTFAYITSYIEKNHLSTWKLFKNPTNLGWKKNFIEAIRKAEGQYVFLADQDDYWYPEKIEKMLKVIETHSNILLLACDYHLVYEKESIHTTGYEMNAGEIEQVKVTKSFFQCMRPGCAYVLRKEFLDDVLPYWQEGYPHDEFLWLLALMREGAFLMHQTLMDFVRHSTNASDIVYKDIKAQLENLDYIERMLNTIQNDLAQQKMHKYQSILEGAFVWCRKRKQLMKTRNIFRWFGLIPWIHYYNSFRNSLSDLWLVLFGSFRRKRR